MKVSTIMGIIGNVILINLMIDGKIVGSVSEEIYQVKNDEDTVKCN